MGKKKDYNKISKNIYLLPFDNKLNLKPELAPSHEGPMINALDFSMEEGTPVYAAADGVVVQVKDDSKKGGPKESLRLEANLVRIKHKNEEYTDYGHLKYKGIVVKPNDSVKAGDLIGYSGITGFTTYPHLHFSVYEYMEDKPKWQTLKPRFRKDKKTLILKSLNNK